MRRIRSRLFSHCDGFTLLELMVVVVIVGILATIAYPSYLEQIRKARRADAEAALMELSQFMERYYTANGRYITNAGEQIALPFTASPKGGTSKYYDLGFALAPTATTYVLSAVPNGTMVGDRCGVLSLTNTGLKGQSSGTYEQCW